MGSIDDILAEKELRIAACEQSLTLFAMYYFGMYFTHEMAGFHHDMYASLENDDKAFSIFC